MLAFFSAKSETVHSSRAMAECIENALDGAGKESVRLLVFHTTMGHNFTELMNSAKELCPGATVVGHTAGGVIGKEGPSERMRALSVMLVQGEQNDMQVSYRQKISGADSYEVTTGMCEELKSNQPSPTFIQVLASGIDLAANRVIDAIEEHFGEHMPIFGGTSSDNMKAKVSFQFKDQEVAENGIILVAYSDPGLRVTMGLHHGSVPIGNSLVVTRSVSNQILELDGRPAWANLMEKLGLPQTTHPGDTIPIAELGEELPEDLRKDYDNPTVDS